MLPLINLYESENNESLLQSFTKMTFTLSFVSRKKNIVSL